MLTRSKNTSYREAMVQVTEVLIQFLASQRLLVPRPSGEGGTVADRFAQFLEEHREELVVRKLPRTEPIIPEELVIWQSDLTLEGKLLFEGACSRWLRAHDRGVPAADVSILERELKKIRQLEK